MMKMRSFRKFFSTTNPRPTIVKSKFHIPELDDGTFRNVSVPKLLLSRIGLPSLSSTECLVDGTVTDRKLSMTFGQTNAIIQMFATALTSHGIKPNSTVALLCPNHIDYFTVFMGVGLVGARTTPVNPLASTYEIEYQLEATDAKLIVTDKSCLTKALEVGRKRNIPVFYLDTAEPASSPVPSDPLIINTMRNVYKTVDGRSIDPEAFFGTSEKFDTESIFMLPFSSGTTGKPKGVVLTHNNITSNILQYFVSEGYTLYPNEENKNTQGSLLIPLPFFHIYGLVIGLMGPLYSNGKVVFMSSFDLKKYLDNIQSHRITRTYIVPPIVLSLIKDPLAAGYDLSSLQCILTAAAPLGKDMQIEAMNKLKCIVKQGWGLTETSPIATLFPDWALRRKDGSVDLDTLIGRSGQLVANMEGKVIDPETSSDLPVGEIGEICVRGPNVMKGYFNNEEATKNTVDADGWLHTGDIGKFDQDSGLTITDRMKELIKYKGFQVAPAELESLINSHPAVYECIVIPVLREDAGEIPRAYVVLKPSAPQVDEAEIVKFVTEKVSPHKKLRGGVVFVKKIPKSASGKLLRRVQIEIDRGYRPPLDE